MGLFDDINQFLEERLDEFLRDNPHLELQAIEEQLREQERDTSKLILKLELEEKSLQSQILETAEDIKTWHQRIAKAEAAQKQDLAAAAKEREAALLRQGNQVWGQMEGVKQRILQSKNLLQQVQQKLQEVKIQSAQSKKSSSGNNSSGDTVSWDQRPESSAQYSRSADPLEAEFQKWEVDEELERIKKNMRK
jgi:uncharacterized protein (TIGR04376 family)